MKGTTVLCVLATALIASANYPPIVKKELYADVDLRGKAAPKIKVEEWLTGERPSTKGKTVLVDMWATWCPSCRDLIPELNDWNAKFKGQLVVIGISDEKPAVVRKFMRTTPMRYNVAVDGQKRLETAVKVVGIPQVLVISPDGVVRWQGFPGSDEDKLTTQKLSDIIHEGNLARR